MRNSLKKISGQYSSLAYFKTGFVTVFILATIIFILKLIMSFNVYGTNDITSWMMFSDVIKDAGTLGIYSLISSYNHPPLISWALKIVDWISVNTGLSFAFVFRFMPILADYAGIFVLWKLLGKYRTQNRVAICAIASINPVNFVVSGFHGNTDPVFIFLILLVAYLLERGNVRAAGFVYGISMCIKIVPIFLAPILILFFKEARARVLFIAYALLCLLCVYLPYLLLDFYSVVNNIFQYSSIPGIWGVGHALKLFPVAIPWAGDLSILLKVVILTIILYVAILLKYDNKVNLLERFLFVFCLFLFLTPGFGLQYLSWLSIFAIAVLPALGTVYVFVGGLFLLYVYGYWGGGVPPYYANSWQSYITLDSCWGGPARNMDFMVWMIIVLMLINVLFRIRHALHTSS